MLFKKTKSICEKCGGDNCKDPYSCKARRLEIFRDTYITASNQLSIETIYSAVMDAPFGTKRVNLVKYWHSQKIYPPLNLKFEQHDFYALMNINYPIKWGDEMIDCPLSIRVAGEFVFNDSACEKSEENQFQGGRFYYHPEGHYFFLQVHAPESYREKVLEFVSQGFQGSESCADLLCKFEKPKNHPDYANQLAVKEWEVVNTFVTRRGQDLSQFNGL